MTMNDLQRAALVLFAAREAGEGASLEQMKAICYCMRNRVRAGWHDGSWLASIEHADEVAAHDYMTMRLDPANRALQRLTHDIDDICYGTGIETLAGEGDLESSIGEQKFWMFLNRPPSSWFVKHIVKDQKNHPSHAQMGLMMFFE